MKNIAVMDLGTNTFRLLIACPGRERDFQTVYTKQKIVRMGKRLSRGGLLTGESIERTMAALKDFTKEMERFDAKEVIAVATSALREAKNGKDLTDHLKWVKFSDVSWTTDSKGFFYSRYDEPESGKELQATVYYQKVFYHKVGDPQDQDQLIYERPDQKEWAFFGQVTEGMDVLDRIANVPVEDRGELEAIPVQTVLIRSVRKLR